MLYPARVAKWISEDSALDAQPGVNLFTGFMPEEVKKGVLILNRLRGSEDVQTMGNYRTSIMTVMNRGSKHDEVEEHAWVLKQRVVDIVKDGDNLIDGILFKQLYAMNDPEVYPRSEGNYIEAATRFFLAFVLVEVDFSVKLKGK